MNGDRFGEFRLIEMIRQRVSLPPSIPLGIGDDTAAMHVPPGKPLLVTTDTLVEGVHFDLSNTEPHRVGRKSLAVNLSDLAAMGGRPLGATLAVAIRPGVGEEFWSGFLDGLLALSQQFRCPLIGGDTSRIDGPFVVTMTAFGEPIGKDPVVRSGARPGDRIFVSGELGGSLAGHHLDFTPRLNEVAWLMQHATPSAMLDISDGLATDLPRLLESSGVGAIVETDSLPRRLVDGRQVSVTAALEDGEDFELCFTLPPERIPPLTGSPHRFIEIGEIIEGDRRWLRDRSGRLTPFPSGGWEHRWDG